MGKANNKLRDGIIDSKITLELTGSEIAIIGVQMFNILEDQDNSISRKMVAVDIIRKLKVEVEKTESYKKYVQELDDEELV